MRRILPEDLEPLAAELRKRAMTLEDIKSACGISRETAYRYLRMLYVPSPEILSQVKAASGDKAWQIIRPS